MTYYSFDTASDTHETGPVFPQIKGMRQGYDFTRANSIHNLNYGQLPGFVPDLNYFSLNDRAKTTDLLSNMISPFGFLLSTKLKEILEKFKLPDHAFYQASVDLANIKLNNYFWFLPICNLSDQVDYTKTKFYSKDAFNNVEKLIINNHEDIVEIKPKIGYTKKIVSENIYFKSGFRLDYDLFMIGGFDFNIYISEDLKSALIKERISGIKLKPISNLVF
ncbi:DUF1629 domain-containing protein [uncultured Algoriphagus sp.]|uniref:imm11 family protein n=1 Tax=uncultured Algoriphagus sp. TaxID=417365 RepID=UPI0030EE2BA5